MSENNRYYGLGTRKEAIAKVWLSKGTGVVTVVKGRHGNFREMGPMDYFHNEFLIQDFMTALVLTKMEKSLDVRCYVRGGGISAQAGAVRLGIAKALMAIDPSLKPILKTHRMLTQDRRFKERKKIGKRGARRSPQFTKR